MNNPMLSGFTATSAMTVFSYAVSDAVKENWKEPQLLNVFVQDHSKSRNYNPASGWLLHYGIGCNWAVAYQVWRKAFGSGKSQNLLFATASGLLGVLAWKFVLRKHSSPPKHLAAFYAHLFLAHMVFTGTLKKSIDN
jgi:hypothetical protein